MLRVVSYLLTFCIEPKSKRVPVRLRNKIEKASAAKQRKAKKAAKKVCRSRIVQERILKLMLEPGMAIQDEERPRDPEPVPIQGQDPRRS